MSGCSLAEHVVVVTFAPQELSVPAGRVLLPIGHSPPLGGSLSVFSPCVLQETPVGRECLACKTLRSWRALHVRRKERFGWSLLGRFSSMRFGNELVWNIQEMLRGSEAKQWFLVGF